MADSHQIIHEKRRGDWVRDAARAIIATSTPALRFMILREGFYRFQVTAIPSFAELSPFTFDSNEIRWMWHFLQRYVRKREAQLQPVFEALYQKNLRRTSPFDDPRDAIDKRERLAQEDGIVTESVTHGRQVH